MKLTVIGTVYVDIKGFPLSKEFFPACRNAGRVEQVHGGVGRNIAEDTANLGVQTAFVGLVDKTGFGSDVVEHLKSRNIDTTYTWATEDGMGTWLAIFDPQGEVCANISKRPNLMPICDILDQHGDEIFAESNGILLEIDMDEEIIARTMALAEKYNVPVFAVISNMTIARERMDYIKQCACFICNRMEAGMFFEMNVEGMTMEDMKVLLRGQLHALGLNSMVVTMDSDGAVYASVNGEEGTVPAQKVDVVDTTGAGDSFFAGVSASLAQGTSLEEACIVGTKMASKVICSVGNVYEG